MINVRTGCILAIVALASGVSAQSGCSNQLTAESCFQLTASLSAICVWNADGCVPDPCGVINNYTQCVAHGCLPVEWTGGNGNSPCMTPTLVCDRLSVTDCASFPSCAVRANAYCTIVPAAAPGTDQIVCEISFPTWSLALMVMWFFIMAILAFIIFLVVKKSKQAAIKGVETQEVVVDSMQIRDNFNLHQPLTQS